MKFWKVSGIAGFVGLCVVLLACSKSSDDNSCVSYAYAPITAVSVPDSAAINTDVPFRFTYNIVNSCGRFYNTDYGTVGDTLTIAVIAQYTGCSCDQLSRIEDSTIPFRSSVAKKYYLKFLQENGNFYRDSIVFK